MLTPPEFWLNASRPLVSCLDGYHLLVISPIHTFPLYQIGHQDTHSPSSALCPARLSAY